MSSIYTKPSNQGDNRRAGPVDPSASLQNTSTQDISPRPSWVNWMSGAPAQQPEQSEDQESKLSDANAEDVPMGDDKQIPLQDEDAARQGLSGMLEKSVPPQLHGVETDPRGLGESLPLVHAPPKIYTAPAATRRTSKARFMAALSLSEDGDHLFGDPFSPIKGLSITLMPDAGEYVDPSISLRVRINKEGKDSGLSSQLKDINTATILWYPGVRLYGRRSMEYFEYGLGLEEPDNSLILPTAIKSLCPTSQPDMIQRIVCVTFESSSHIEIGRYEQAWAVGLPKETEHGLNDLFGKRDENRWITLWFCHGSKENDYAHLQ